MEPKEFVRQSLEQIILGVKEAQASESTQGASIAPGRVQYGDPALKIEEVEFDVALTVEYGTEDRSGGALLLAGIGIGAQRQAQDRETHVSRIKFKVPLVLPVGRKL